MIIYKLTNKANGKVYIGQTIKNSPNDRWNRHIRDLTIGEHHNAHLQAAWNKYGESCWEFSILEEGIFDIDDLVEREIYWTNKYNSTDNSFGYNKRVGNNRTTLTEDARKRISAALKGKKRSPEVIEKLRKANSGENHPMWGKKASEETRRKMSEARKGEKHPFYGKTRSKATMEKIKKTREEKYPDGFTHSEETRKKMSKSRKGVPKSKEWVEKIQSSRRKTMELRGTNFGRKKKLQQNQDGTNEQRTYDMGGKV